MVHDRTTVANSTPPALVTLTTEQVTGGTAVALAAALRASGVTVEQRTFMPVPDPTYPWGVLLMGVIDTLPALVRLIDPRTGPTSVAPALAAALGIGHRPVLATLQLKAVGVFVSLRVRDRADLSTALAGLLEQAKHLDTRRAERRLVYDESTWHIDP